MTREEAIKALERAEDYVGIHYINGVEDPYINPYLLKAIDFAVAALREQEERRWIPVTERLPSKEEYTAKAEDGTEYYVRLLIAYKTDIVEYEIGYYDGYKWMTEMPIRLIKDVVAWMPFPNMPQPPKEE